MTDVPRPLPWQLRFLDYDEPCTISHERNAVHAEQPGVVTMVTWCVVDAVPHGFFADLRQAELQWLSRHGFDARRPLYRREIRKRSPKLWMEYYERFIFGPERLLDQCRGSCPLRDPKLAGIVAESLLYFDEQRYLVLDFVVMPNHVHVLFCMRGEGMVHQVRRWKRYTARAINQELGRSGAFWHRGFWDRMMRNRAHFLRCRRYVAENPYLAGLEPGSYIHYSRPLPRKIETWPEQTPEDP